MKLHTDNGSINVWLPGGRGYAISASTDNGGKRIDPDSASSRRVEVHTRNGSVTVRPADQRS